MGVGIHLDWHKRTVLLINLIDTTKKKWGNYGTPDNTHAKLKRIDESCNWYKRIDLNLVRSVHVSVFH